MTNYKKFILFFMILQLGLPKLWPQTSVSKTGTMRYISLPLLIVVHSNSAGKIISDKEISKIKNSVALVRNFIWRNSRCRFNLLLSYLTIDATKSVTFFSTDGLPEKNKLEAELIAHGMSENQFGIIAVVYKPPFGGKDVGGMKIFQRTGYAIVRFPSAENVIYPAETDSIDGGFVYSFLRAIQGTVRFCYLQSKVNSFPASGSPEILSENTGAYFSEQAEIWRSFSDYFSLDPFYGKIRTTRDEDGDGFPDHDTRVPVDEFHFGSDTLKKDSDADGLDDRAEFAAGIYRSSQPTIADTDHDGIIDGSDALPLHAIHTEIPFFTPQLENTWVSWFQITNQLDFSPLDFFVDIPLQTKIFINWDEQFLYFGCEMNIPARLHLDLDLANDGWQRGKDNYQLVADPFANRFIEIHALDASAQVRESVNSPALWDDDPEYVTRFGKILDESDIQLVTESQDENYIIKIKIPNNPKADFQLSKNKKIGIRIWFDAPELAANDARASVFELYRFFTITLK
ncbi:MAG: hypothetical protein GXO74_13070 [Calditrichaeota bacterium]|nr:hypothetical protein [Calditrichota bacterium]